MLVVEHEAQCPPGWMGQWMSERGVELDVRRPYAGDALPGDLSDHSAMLVLGGSMNAYDDDKHPWLTDVKGLVLTAVADGTPTLGICLGHQLIAVALGGRVERNPRGQQIGVIPVGWRQEAYDDPLLGPLSGGVRAVQWNNDIVVRLPDGATVLAGTPAGEIQAARFASAVWGVQWHPEAHREIVAVWAEHDRDDAIERGVDLDAYVDAVGAAREEMRATWRGLADRFTTLARDRVIAS